MSTERAAYPLLRTPGLWAIESGSALSFLYPLAPVMDGLTERVPQQR